MNTLESEQEYPAFALDELADRIKNFLMPYSFVKYAYLYNAEDIGKYHIVFMIPEVPQDWCITRERSQESKSNTENFKYLFKTENFGRLLLSMSQGSSQEVRTGIHFYTEFFTDVLMPTLNGAQLEKVKFCSIQENLKPLDNGYLFSAVLNQKPLGLSLNSCRLEKQEWDIAANIENILARFYPITIGIEYKDDIRNLSLPDFVRSEEPILLYERLQETIIDIEKERRKEIYSDIGRAGGRKKKSNVVLEAALRLVLDKRPELKEKSSAIILRHIKRSYSDTNPLRIAGGTLYCVDGKLETSFRNKDKQIAPRTFYRYVQKIKKEF